MKARGLWLLLACGALAAGASHGSGAAPSRTPDPFVRGVALGLFASDPRWDYGPMIDEIAARGATDVLVVVPLSQRDRFAADVARANTAPDDSHLAHTLAQLRGAGLRSALMPIVGLRARPRGGWRGVLAPAQGVGAWFAAYERELCKLAELAASEDVTRLVVGSELLSLEAQQAHWEALVSKVRERFSGTLTYSANWDHFRHVPFWHALDEVGITGYFPVDRERAAAGWTAAARSLHAFGKKIGKPVLFTELGYPSQEGAQRRPWHETRDAAVDLSLQRELWASACEGLWRGPALSGFYAWNWFGYGGPRDAGFTLRGKPAAGALASCFARRWQPHGAQGHEP